MTTAEPAATRESPVRNWGGVVIAITGAALVITGVLNGASRSIVDFPTAFFGPIFGIQVGLIALSPIALVVGFAPIAFGGSGLVPISGSGARNHLWVFAAPVVALLAEYTVVGRILSEALQTNESAIADLQDVAIMVSVFAVLVVLAAGIVIARAGVVAGFARWSLIVAVALIAVTVAAGLASVGSDWESLPFAVGILLVGLSWWRAGLQRNARVPVGSKSLAE